MSAILKYMGFGLLILFFISPSTDAQELNLDALIDEALANNPELSTLKYRWEAFETRVPQAGALDDPMFRFDASNLPLSNFNYTSTAMTGNQLMLSQNIPFPGTLAGKERAAQHGAEAAEELYKDRAFTIVNMVKQAYFTLAFLDRSIDITEKNEDLLEDFVRIAQTKYSVGRGLQQDVLKAQVTLSGFMDRLINLKTMRRTAEARLNLILNRSPQASVGLPGDVSLTPFEMVPEEIQQMAIEIRPLLKAVDRTTDLWRATEQVAKKQLWPNFSFNLGYRQRAVAPGDPVAGSDFLSLGVGLNIPIYQGRKQRQKISEARANIRMSQSQHEATRQKILYHIQTVYLEIEQHRDEAELFKTAILPQAEQSLESALAGYQVDEVDFLTLLHNQVTLFNFEIDYYRHLTEHEKRLAELEAAVGKRLF